MIGIHTSGVIATMTYPHSFRNRTMHYFPLEAASNVNERSRNFHAESTIAVPLAGFPFPTSVSFLVFRVESSDIFRGKHGFKYNPYRGAEQC
jgi:hypothetical protein